MTTVTIVTPEEEIRATYNRDLCSCYEYFEEQKRDGEVKEDEDWDGECHCELEYLIAEWDYIDDEDHKTIIKDIINSRRYHRIDGWRGYYEVFPDEKKYSHLDLGFNWLSGHHSYAKEEKKMELLKGAFKQLDMTLIFVTNQTGNFAAYTDVYCWKEQYDALSKVSDFINDFVGDRDSRWDVGTLMHFDSDEETGKRIQAELDAQTLPLDWDWKVFIEKYDEMKANLPKFKEKGFSDMDFNQQVGVLAGKGSAGLMAAQTMIAIKRLQDTKRDTSSYSPPFFR